MATITVQQQKLVLNTFATIFQNELRSADIVQWKQHDGVMDDRNGLSVIEQVGPRYAPQSTTSGVADLTSGVQDSVFGSEIFTVNKTFNVSMGWGDFVKIRDIGDARESAALKGAAQSLAEYIDAYVMGVAGKASNNWVNTSSGNVGTYDQVATAYTRLKEEGVGDNDLALVLAYADRQALGTAVVAYTAQDKLATDAFRKGFDGDIDGVPTIFTQQLPVLTTGSRAASGAAQMNGANQNSNYSSVATSTSPGFYMTQTISINGLTGSQTVKAGECFTIAGVYAWDPRAGVARSNLQQFTVIADATASSGAIAALRIFPAIIVPNTGSGGDINVNTAHATCDSVPGATAAITWVGTASTAQKPRFLIQKEAIVVDTVPLIMPATGIGSTKQLNKVPLNVRMWQHSDFNTGQHSIRFDVALTANVRERRRIIRLNGVA